MASNVAGTVLQTARLNWVKGSAYLAAPVTLYLALFTTQPANDGTGGVEVSGGSYARVPISSSSGWSSISGASPSIISNAATITFTTATAGWGTIVGVGIYSALTTGNLYYNIPLTSSRVVNSGDTVSFAIGSVVLEED